MRPAYPGIAEEQCQLGPLDVSQISSVLEVELSGHTFPWSEGVLRDCFAPGYVCWGLWFESDLQGFAILSWQYDELHLLNLCIRSSYQRSGLGRRLLRYAIARARAARARCMLLEVRASNQAAIALYMQEGFDVIGWRKDYYPAVQGREDAQVMSLGLPGQLA